MRNPLSIGDATMNEPKLANPKFPIDELVAAPAALPEHLRQRDLAPRTPKPLAQFIFGGQWGATANFTK